MSLQFLTRPTGLYTKKTKKGRGVFTGNRILEGNIVEACSVLVFQNKHVSGKSELFCYVWEWKPANRSVIALGIGSLFNHSPTPNVDVQQFFKQERMIFTAARDIQAGEELTVDYNCELWFKVLD